MCAPACKAPEGGQATLRGCPAGPTRASTMSNPDLRTSTGVGEERLAAGIPCSSRVSAMELDAPGSTEWCQVMVEAPVNADGCCAPALTTSRRFGAPFRCQSVHSPDWPVMVLSGPVPATSTVRDSSGRDSCAGQGPSRIRLTSPVIGANDTGTPIGSTNMATGSRDRKVARPEPVRTATRTSAARVWAAPASTRARTPPEGA